MVQNRDYLSLKVGALVDTAYPLACFSEDPVVAQQRYVRFIEAGVSSQAKKELSWHSDVPCFGSQDFKKRYVQLIKRPRVEELRFAPESLEAVELRVASQGGVTLSQLRSGRRNRALCALKRIFADSACKAGSKLYEIAAFLGCTPSAVSKLLA